MNNQESDWKKAWSNLGEMADVGKISLTQYNSIVKLWCELTKTISELAKPAFGFTEDGSFYFAWSYEGESDSVATIEVLKDGQLDWYYKSAKTSYDGSGSLEDCLKCMTEPLDTFTTVCEALAK